MPRYLISMTQADAAKAEAMFGHRGEIVPSGGYLGEAREGAIIAGMDAITDEEYEPIRRRLASAGGLIYHAGGPTGHQASEIREARQRSETVRQRYSKQHRARLARVLGEHRAEEFAQIAREHSRDGKVPLEDVLDLMVGAWETGRSPHHNRED